MSIIKPGQGFGRVVPFVDYRCFHFLFHLKSYFSQSTSYSIIASAKMMQETPPPQEDNKTESPQSSNWRHRTAAALERRRWALEARQQQEKAQSLERQANTNAPPMLKKRLKQGLVSVGNALQKINIGKWIDDLERDQELADSLEDLNRENKQQAERLSLCREAQDACRQAIQEHLKSFLKEYPQGSYEDWIRDLHPDNVNEKDNSIDPRFYVPDDHHRLIWNEAHPIPGEREGLVEEDLTSSSEST